MKPADYGRLLLLAAIWGASFLFMRIAAPAFGAVNTTFLRVLFALIGLAVMLLLLRAPWGFRASSSPPCCSASSTPPSVSDVRHRRPLAAGRLLGHPQRHHAADGALIGFSCFNERLDRRKWLGVVLG